MAIFTLLGMDTGFDKRDILESVCPISKGGLEPNIINHPKILKDPNFLIYIEEYITKNNKIPDYVIIPIRDFKESAKSRYNNSVRSGVFIESIDSVCLDKYSHGNGGLWNARDINEQVEFYNKCLSKYIRIMVEYDLKTIFLDFEKMTLSHIYLYDSLKHLLPKDITLDIFLEAWTEATEICKTKFVK